MKNVLCQTLDMTIKFENVCFRANEKLLLNNINIDISSTASLSGHLAVTGRNGSGKSLFAMMLSGLIAPTSGKVIIDGKVGYASFELQQKIMDEERRKDNSRFLPGTLDSGTLVKDFICPDVIANNALFEKYIELFKMEKTINRGLRYLSTGEFRKALLCRALLEKPDILVIDDPFDGLDAASRENLQALLKNISCNRKSLITSVVLITSRISHIPSWFENIVVIDGGSVIYSGKQDSWKNSTSQAESNIAIKLDTDFQKESTVSNNSVIEMKNVAVSYNGQQALAGVNWSVKKGERWIITGPNGCGKSTLMSLINGDNPKAYGCDITLFGKKKGSGESVWDIKKRIGFVSGDFQMSYIVSSTLLELVLSGYKDSVGLYSDVTELQKEEALTRLSLAGLAEKKDIPVQELSYGEKRVALILRALIKKPELLIFDEPCQGLDDENTFSVISAIESLSEIKDITILLVTHDENIRPKNFDHYLQFVPYSGGGNTVFVQ